MSRYNGSPAGIDVANARVETVKQRIVDGGIDAKRITSSTRVADNELDTFDYDALARARRVEVTISD